MSDVQEAVGRIKGRAYQGSSIAAGTLYHNLPFNGFDHLKSHRMGTRDRWNLIKDKSGVDFKGKTVLDLGCNVGGMSIFAAQEKAHTVIGFDHDKESIALAKLAIEKLGLKDKNIDFRADTISLEWIQSLRHFNIIMWLSQWMWSAKQYGLDMAKDMMFAASQKCNIMIFESAANDAMAAIKGATQDDIHKWLCENTMFSSVKDIGFVPTWNSRHIFVCEVPIGFWRGFTSTVVRINRSTMRKTYRQQFLWMIEREAKFLKMLEGYPNFPKLVATGNNYIDISYCGNRSDIRPLGNQCQEILKVLKEKKITHRDINPKNLLTLYNRLYLVDFGWALLEGEKDTPVAAPANSLGGKYYRGHRWDDAKAMEISLQDGVYKAN